MKRKNTKRPSLAALASALCLAQSLGFGLPALFALPSELAGKSAADSRDPVAERLFAPELVMSHQSEIALSATQRQMFIQEVQRLQTEVVPLQFEVQAASEALIALLAAERIEESKAIAQARRLMDLEMELKAKHLTLLVRIKNLLTAEQQAKLAAIRSAGSR